MAHPLPTFTPLPFDTVLPWLAGLWLASAIGSALFFRYSRNARRKHAVWVTLMVGGNLAFFVVACLIGAPWYWLLAAAVIGVIGARRSIARTRFCQACGGNHFPMDSAVAPDTCRHCGARLDLPHRVPTVL